MRNMGAESDPIAVITLGGDRAGEAVDVLCEALYDHRDAVWAELGDGPRQRYESLGEVWQEFPVRDPHHHLNMIGVRGSHGGRGLGRVLLEAVHEMAENDPVSSGVSLTTEDAANLPLYEHFGYRVVDHRKITDDLETWGFFRAK